MDTNGGVYTIKNINNGKLYVGGSKELPRRETNHFYALAHRKHINNYLQNAWNKHGENAFVFGVLEIVDSPDLLTEREQWWIDHLMPYKHEYGYNIRKDVSDGRRGTVCPKEIRGKISTSMKKYVRTHEHCKNIAISKTGVCRKGQNTGREVSAETRARISKSKQGQQSGSLNNKSKFDEATVLEIREMLANGRSGLSIANEHGVYRSTIYQIRDRKTWKHI